VSECMASSTRRLCSESIFLITTTPELLSEAHLSHDSTDRSNSNDSASWTDERLDTTKCIVCLLRKTCLTALQRQLCKVMTMCAHHATPTHLSRILAVASVYQSRHSFAAVRVLLTVTTGPVADRGDCIAAHPGTASLQNSTEAPASPAAQHRPTTIAQIPGSD
jgi:hypothetical protein